MDEFSDFSDLSKILIDAPGNPVIWNTFLCRLAEVAACTKSFLIITDLDDKEDAHILFNFNLPDKTQQLTINNFNNAEYFNKLLNKNPCQVICSQKPSTQATYDYNSHLNLQYYFGFSIPYNSHHALTLCVNRHHPFSYEEQDRISLLLLTLIIPLQAAIKIELERKIYSQILLHTYNHSDSFVIVNSSLEILFSDSIFLSVIDKCRCVKVTNKQIYFTDPNTINSVPLLMKQNKMASINKPSAACQITLIPVSALDNLYGWECFQDSFVLAFTYNKENNPVIKRLIDIHKLSKCEAMCAMEFLQTPSIIEIAANTYRSQDTIRNHIKHIMHKMNVHSQAALMKKILSLTVL